MEQTLLTACKNGDTNGWKTLYKQYVDLVFHLSFRITSNREMAKDASQQVFTQVFKNLGNFRSESELGTWIYRIATNISLDMVKSDQRRSRLLEENTAGAGPELQDNGHATDTQLGRISCKRLLDDLSKKFDPDIVKTFWLYSIEGLEQQEISRVQDLTIPAIKKRLERVRLYLKKKISRDALS